MKKIVISTVIVAVIGVSLFGIMTCREQIEKESSSVGNGLEGYAVMLENGGLEMVAITHQDQGYEPIGLSGDFELPATISTGDNITITYEGPIEESYPSTILAVNKVKINKEGESSDVPSGMLEELEEYGRKIVL